MVLRRPQRRARPTGAVADNCGHAFRSRLLGYVTKFRFAPDGPVRLLGALLLLALLSAGAEAAAPKRVLVIHSFARDSAPYNALSNVLRSELTQQLNQAVALQEVSLDAELGGEPKDEHLFVEYLVGRARVTPPDLVIAIANPAMLFCLRHRDQLFPDRPLLATGLDRRRLDTVKLGAFDQAVTMTLDFPAVVRNILELKPDTDTLAIVVGASPLEQFWGDVIERELAPLGNRLRVLPAGVVSLAQMRQRLAALPPNSVALYYGFAVGADGALHENELALASIRESSSVPVFGVYNDQLGRGIVGGPLVDFRTMGSVTAELAVRMLQNPGAPGGHVALPTPPAIFDWRELRHWAIPESQLPKGAVVRFREPSIWDLYHWHIAAAALVIIVQSVLIALMLCSAGSVGLRRSKCGSSAPSWRGLHASHARRVERVHRSRGEPAAGRDIEQCGCSGAAARCRSAQAGGREAGVARSEEGQSAGKRRRSSHSRIAAQAGAGVRAVRP